MSARLRLSLALLLFAALPGLHADPGDFAGMPGLWMTSLHRFHGGKETGKPEVIWHCVDEDADPWENFANLPVPGHEKQQCERSAEQRTNVSLAWTLSCPGPKPAQGNGRVDFDSAKHYTARVELNGGDRLEVEGIRRAACTSPKD